jgi:hypothetical protein
MDERMAGPPDKPFRFLTTEEFNLLNQADKVAYIGNALVAINEQTTTISKLFIQTTQTKDPPGQ